MADELAVAMAVEVRAKVAGGELFVFGNPVNQRLLVVGVGGAVKFGTVAGG